MNIILNHNQVGMDAGQARSTLSSASWRREDVQFIDPAGNVINIPAKSDIVTVMTELADKNGLQALDRNGKPMTKDYLAQWEKDYAVKVLTNQDYKVGARDTTNRYGPAKEWDSFVLTVDGSVSDDEFKKVKDVVQNVLASPSLLGGNDSNGVPVPFPGINGKRALIVSETHDNTGNRHLHVMAHRHAFDTANKEVSTGIDFSKNGVVATVAAEIEAGIRAAGLTQTFAFTSGYSKAVANNVQAVQATQAAQSQVLDAGGKLDSQFVVEVPTTTGTKTVNAPLTPDAMGMQSQSQILKKESEQLNLQIQKLMQEAKAKAEAAAKIDMALQAMADNEVLKSSLEDANTQINTLSQEKDALSTANDVLTAQHDDMRKDVTNIGQNLAEQSQLLGLNEEVAESLQKGDIGTIAQVTQGLADTAATWNEALDQIDEETAQRLREDPIEGLQELLNSLNEFKTENPLLKEQVNTLTAENTQLKSRVTELEAERNQAHITIDTLKADMTRMQSEHEEKMNAWQRELDAMSNRVTEAEKARITAEGKLAATEQILGGQIETLQMEAKRAEKAAEQLVAIMHNHDLYLAEHPEELKTDTSARRLLAAFTEVDKKHMAVNSELENTKKEIEQVREEAEAARQEAAKAQEIFAELHKAGIVDIKAYAQERQMLEQTVEGMKTEIEKLTVETAALVKIKEENAQFKNEITALNTQLSEADTAIKSLSENQSPSPSTKLVAFLDKNPDVKAAILRMQNDPSFRNEINGMLGVAQSDTPSTDYTVGLRPEDNVAPAPKKDDPEDDLKV